MAEPPRFGAYEVIRPLSSGGMGSVYVGARAGVHGFRKKVAIKTLRLELAESEASRTAFHDEAHLLSRIDHPNIGQVYDYGEQDGVLYLVMELVDGVSLSQVLTAHGRLPPRAAVQVMAQVARALHAAHSAVGDDGHTLGVVHRDVSPQNILLTAGGAVKLIDFGIALARDRLTPTTVDAIKGKPAYMAPEQLMSEPLDARCDVFAAAVVLHEMLTGTALFARDTFHETVTAVLHTTPHPVSRTVPELPEALDRLVLHGLERDPKNRVRSALDFAQALEDLAQSLPGPALDACAAGLVAKVRNGGNRFEAATAAGGFPQEAREARTQLRKSGARSPLVLTFVLLGLAGAIVWFGTKQPPPPVTLEKSAPAVTPEPPPPPAPIATIALLPVPEDVEPPVAPPVAEEPPEPVQHYAPPGPEPRKRHVTKPIVPAPELGLVSVISEPQAKVRIDGTDMGTTPLAHVWLPVGEHTVELVDPQTSEVRTTSIITADTEHETRVSVR